MSIKSVMGNLLEGEALAKGGHRALPPPLPKESAALKVIQEAFDDAIASDMQRSGVQFTADGDNISYAGSTGWSFSYWRVRCASVAKYSKRIVLNGQDFTISVFGTKKTGPAVTDSNIFALLPGYVQTDRSLNIYDAAGLVIYNSEQYPPSRDNWYNISTGPHFDEYHLVRGALEAAIGRGDLVGWYAR